MTLRTHSPLLPGSGWDGNAIHLNGRMVSGLEPWRKGDVAGWNTLVFLSTAKDFRGPTCDDCHPSRI